MDGGLAVTLLSVAMFVGCFLLGFIPLLFTLSERSLRFVSILGAGLLCGTALAITIPEGVGLLEESWRVSSCSSDAPSGLNASETNTLTERGPSPPRFFIGVALTLGFIFMFVVDQIGSYLSMRDQATCLSNRVGITATLGLVIHAAADGFALGAAVASGQVTVQVIVFLAVILHKAPAAFGLVSFLMHAGNQLSATGVGMLLSAGTFLYVATVHVLPEISSSRTGQPSSDLQQHTGAETHQPHYLGFLESATLILGVGLPMVLALWLSDDK